MARIVAFRRHIPGDGCDSGHACLHFGKGAGQTSLEDLADAPDLSSDAQLLHLEGDLARRKGCMGELG